MTKENTWTPDQMRFAADTCEAQAMVLRNAASMLRDAAVLLETLGATDIEDARELASIAQQV